MTYRLGIDIGGTFTDFSLLEQATGRLIGYESPTVPHDLAAGVAAGLRDLVQREGIDLSRIGGPDGAHGDRAPGRLDILANNAGIVGRVGALETGKDDWDAVMRVNVNGVFLCSRRRP